MSSISVIMPAHNAARTICDSIQSILKQSVVTELLVVDDHSTDRTAEVARKVGDARVVILRSEKRGIVAALNYGISKASGDYIARCDADDLYPEDRLSWQLSWLESNPEYIAVSGGFRAISADGRELADLACHGSGRDVTAMLLDGTAVTHLCSWLIRTQVIRRMGGARSWFKLGEDIDLQLCLARYGRIWHEPRISYLYRLHDEFITHQNMNHIKDFYITSAKRFAVQRAQRGCDDLELGSPPPLPESSNGYRQSATDHSISLLVGAAWNQHRQGKKIASVQIMLSAIGLNPLRLSSWKGLVMLIIKPVT